MVNNLKELIIQLKNNSNVVSIIEYGSRNYCDSSIGGDYDIFVIVKDRLFSIESLHFYINEIPVDLNIRTVEDLKKKEPLSFIDLSIFDGRIIYDKNNTVNKLLKENKGKWFQKKTDYISEHDIEFERFSKKHVLDKVKGRLKTNPVMCQLLLNTNVYWLLQSYFKFNNMNYPGEKGAINFIKKNEPDIYKKIKDFYHTDNLEEKVVLTKKLSNQILKNLGGLWQKDEIIAFGINNNIENLKKKGKKVYNELIKPRNCV